MAGLEIVGRSSQNNSNFRSLSLNTQSGRRFIDLRTRPRAAYANWWPKAQPSQFTEECMQVRKCVNSSTALEFCERVSQVLRHSTPLPCTQPRFPSIRPKPPKVHSLRDLPRKAPPPKQSSLLKKPLSSCSSASEHLDSPTAASTVRVVRPLYKGRPSTVFFPYLECSFLEPKPETNTRCLSSVQCEQSGLSYYVSEGMQYSCIIDTLEQAGLEESEPSECHIYIGGRVSTSQLRQLQLHQKVNHFPGSSHLGRKDLLWRHLFRMQKKFPEAYQFCPQTFLLPEDLSKFREAREKRPGSLWIAKPPNGACGRGIKILRHRREPQGICVISHYVDNPHLIHGLKYDLRLYVCVTSFAPLRVYLFEEGLVRFATLPYSTDPASLKKKCVHLTNYSINKASSHFVSNVSAEEDGIGSKWSLSAYRKYLASQEVNVNALFSSIHAIIIKTLIAVESFICKKVKSASARRDSCFEVYGFDVLITDEFAPVLLEVNVTPSLNLSSPLDTKVKAMLVSDSLTLAGVPVPQPKQKSSGRGEAAAAGIVVESIEEHERRGHFHRIFPTKAAVSRFRGLFEVNRPENEVLWKSLQDPKAVVHPHYKRRKYCC